MSSNPLMKNEEFMFDLSVLLEKHTFCEAAEALWVLNHTKNIESTLQVLYYCQVNNIKVRSLNKEQIIEILLGNIETLMAELDKTMEE